MNHSWKFALALPLVSLALAGCSGGEEAAEVEQPAIVKERQATLKKYGAAAKAIKEELDKESPSFEVVAPHVALLVENAPQMTTWFPEGTSEGTEALPVIWEQPEEFAAKAETLSAAAQKMQAAVEAQDVAALGEAFGETGMACKGCHDTFRMKDD